MIAEEQLDTSRHFHISLGKGFMLSSTDFFVDVVFGGLISKRALTCLLRALHVPVLHVRGHKMVDVAAFRVAMKSILRIGEHDFLLPGEDPPPVECVREIDIEKFERNYAVVVEELLASARSWEGNEKELKKTKKIAVEASKRIIAHALAGAEHHGIGT